MRRRRGDRKEIAARSPEFSRAFRPWRRGWEGAAPREFLNSSWKVGEEKGGKGSKVGKGSPFHKIESPRLQWAEGKKDYDSHNAFGADWLGRLGSRALRGVGNGSLRLRSRWEDPAFLGIPRCDYCGGRVAMLSSIRACWRTSDNFFALLATPFALHVILSLCSYFWC